jgi:uncharacterized membrane protein
MSPHTNDTAKNLSFVAALLIQAVGAVGILVPSFLVWIAEHSATSGAFYVIATVRVALGLVLISAAAVSRAPKTIRFLGYFALIAGIATAVMGLVAMERARAIVEWWLQQGSGVVRLTGVLALAIGGFVAYACAPARRAAGKHEAK